MNRDWTKLKQSSNGLPTYDSLLPYVLEVTKNEEETTNKVIKQRLFDFLQVPKEVREKTYPDYPDTEPILPNRVSFTISDLFKAGALKRVKRGVYQITDSGLKILEKYGEKLSKKHLEAQPEYIQYMSELQLRNQRTDGDSEAPNTEQPELNITKIINTKNNETAIELLDKIRDSNPFFFERLVVNLLDKMGYSGENGDAKVTSRSNDGGIDGIINQDPLGTSTVYLQAKRYKEENVIGRAAIQGFYGALAGVNADRGVFITTSSFSKGSKEFAKGQGIVLIDGIQLTELMLRYEVGVEKANEYIIYRIDNDFFELEE